MLLPAVLTAYAAGDRAAAGDAAEELQETALLMGTDALLGLAAVAAATLADDEAPGAVEGRGATISRRGTAL